MAGVSDNGQGTITYTFTDETGWTLSSTAFDSDYNCVALTNNTLDQQEEFEDNVWTDWFDSSSITQDTSNKFFGVSSGKCESAANDYSQYNVTGTGVISGHQTSIMFYDDGSSAVAGGNRIVQFLSGAAGRLLFFGIRNGTSPSNYSYRLAAGGWVDSGIVRSTGWHRLTYFANNAALQSTVYLDNGIVTTSAQLTITAIVRIVTNASGFPLSADRLWHKRTRIANPGGFFPATGTAVSPELIPDKVYKWINYNRSVVSNVYFATAGDTYDAQYTTDGGSNYGTNSPSYNDGNWETLSATNLSAVVVDSDGNDGIKLRVNLAPQQTSTSTPGISQVIINYAPSSVVLNNCVINNAIIQ